MLGGGIITPNIQERKNGNMKRKGFTLVELLIVIVVIGILSAMMMLSSTEAVSSAKASTIVSNLRNLKTAALAWYIDSMDVIEGRANDGNGQSFTWNTGESTVAYGWVKHYLNNSTATDLDNYSITKDKDGKWFIFLKQAKNTDANVKTKLKARAASTGLLKDAATGTANQYDGGSSSVYMLVR